MLNVMSVTIFLLSAATFFTMGLGGPAAPFLRLLLVFLAFCLGLVFCLPVFGGCP